MKFYLAIHEPIPNNFKASTREEAWEVLQLWLDNQIELREIPEPVYSYWQAPPTLTRYYFLSSKKEIDEKMELANFTQTDITGLDQTEVKILLDYFKGQDAIKHLQNGHSYLCDQFGISFKKTRKPRTVIEQAEEVVDNHDTIPDTLAHLTSGKNALGGSNGKIANHIKFTPEVLERIAKRYVEVWGIAPERTKLISTCPKCSGHFKTSFEYDGNDLVQDEQDNSRMIRKSYTVFNCESCGHTERLAGGQSGKYLKGLESPKITTIPCAECGEVFEPVCDGDTYCQKCIDNTFVDNNADETELVEV